jgi:hypothetical protein
MRWEACGSIGWGRRLCERQILPGPRKKIRLISFAYQPPKDGIVKTDTQKFRLIHWPLHRIEAKVSHVRNGRKISGWGRWCKPYDEDLKKFLFKVKHCRKHRFLYPGWKIPENPGIMLAYEGACADQVVIRLRGA